MALLEFTIEPFVDGRPGPHVTAAIDAAAARGIAVDVGPFGTSCAVPDHEAGEVAAAIIDSALANGATHVTIDVSLTGTGTGTGTGDDRVIEEDPQ